VVLSLAQIRDLRGYTGALEDEIAVGLRDGQVVTLPCGAEGDVVTALISAVVARNAMS
jgi:hypothetical protein